MSQSDNPEPESKQPIPVHAKRVFEGKIFDIYQWEQKLFDGSTTVFEKISRNSTVMVLPITEEDKIILTDQEQPVEGRFIGAVGGRVDEGELPLAAAKRELQEETGLTASEWILWDAVQLFSKIEWPVYTYVAKGLTRAGEQALDSGERIELKYVSFEEFVTIATGDTFRDLEIALKIFRMRQSPDNLERMKTLFSGS